ncbi:AAA domain-containing protein [Verrucomicrobium sp. BvORR034]|uniref:protein kinase domain-containing protein n=1 Tax=Verrucomicrobium sp. BvORR034 TaxID=1396418 RepID=UPI000678FDCE|nr:AAA domain-containing protein [Verrucomicrobium sp. BvORR034]
MIRHCPRCQTDRSLEELLCQGRFSEAHCGWPLYDILPTPPATAREEPPAAEEITTGFAEGTASSAIATTSTCTTSTGLLCRNGHALEPGDFLCLDCGEPAITPAAPQAAPPDTVAITVHGWTLGEELPVHSGESDLRLATQADATGVFKHYRRGIEPEISLYPALRTLDAAHGVRLLDSGRHEDRAYEVWEYHPHGTLGDIPPQEKARPEIVRHVVAQLGPALHALAQIHIIHRDLKPANVLVRSREPLDLVLADFSTATVSEFDLQLTLSRQTTRYAAPETIAGTCSPASDWWSLGVMVLEMLTEGRGFEGVHERAFLLHLVTRGLQVPADLPPDWQELLKGLLARDPSLRWSWPQVERWLQGERGIPHGYSDHRDESPSSGVTLSLGGRTWPTPESFALAAVEAAHWEEARDLLLSGRISTWLQERSSERDLTRAAQVRDVAAETTLPEDARLSAALLLLNDHLPLCLRGEIITPSWLLSHPDTAWQWLDSPLPHRLRQLGRETWLVRLKERAERLRTRVRELDLEFDETQLSAAMLATSQTMLENRWAQQRRLYPEAEHPALISLAQRRSPTEEDLILLISASQAHFRPASDVLKEAGREAHRAQVPFTPEPMAAWFAHSRAEILKAVDQRLQNFARCGRQIPDQWADDFRQDRRITLARALVLLAIPQEEWREPARQEYVRNILHFFHRRLVTGLQRGGLIRMTIGRTSARLDLTELGGPGRPALALLDAVLTRLQLPLSLDPTPLLAEPLREKRLRRLAQNALSYRRDTGINPLYLGFPFIVLRDARASESAKPRIAPVLLWPVRLDMPAGQRSTVKLGFDEEREIRPNPALEGLLGPAFPSWRDMLNDLRARDHLDLQAVLDAFSPLATLPPAMESGPDLCPLPPATVTGTPGAIQLHAAAVLFHCDFSGQTIAQDIDQISKGIPLQGTALETAIRAGDATDAPEPPSTLPAELDRYFTAASDPSQQSAVFRTRHGPGLLVQGPPGTGKSQTIVNIVSDAIGRGERVLIVCQKQAALEVVRKRLDTEGLGGRLFYLKDTTSDRRPTLQDLRGQLEQPAHSPHDNARLQREREGLARHIDSLERELTSAHLALHEGPADRPGHLSYREVLDELLQLESERSPITSHPGVGALFRELDHAGAWQMIAEMAPLTPLWLRAQYEQSPLHDLSYFSTNESTLVEFRQAFEAFQQAERHRHALLRQHDHFFSLDSPEQLKSWLAEHEAALRALPAPVVRHLSQWAAHLAKGGTDASSSANQLVPWLEGLSQKLAVLTRWTLDARLYARLAERGDAPLRQLSRDAARLAAPASFWEKLNPTRFFARNKLHRWLTQAGVGPDNVDLTTLHQAAELENELRQDRPMLTQWLEVLGLIEPGSATPLPVMQRQIRPLIEQMQLVLAAARRVQSCPVQLAASTLLQGGDPALCASVLDACHASLSLWPADCESKLRLDQLRPWFTPGWISTRLEEIDTHAPGSVPLEPLAAAFPTLPEFQTFRARAQSLSPVAFAVYAKLREKEATWSALPSSRLPDQVTATLQREALLEWKRLLEESHPSLLIESDEFEEKVRLLGQKDQEFREANRHLLSRCAADAPLSPRSHWDDVVMFTGPRARRLREVVERGEPLGLLHLRPVWMMNPEMVSRLFPLRPGLFDVVIFDEASQLPVESALPALFRARRMVVSGDEKQMPPSRFFGSHLESDEEEDADSWLAADDAGLDELERERLAQAAGRREVKDCPDLLTLAQNLLPTATLEIHYRSRYRQLIDFSNAAFYANRLSVPARHPDSEILRARPMEVDRVEGEYFDQTNEDEAARVVFRLQEIWRQPAEQRPSIGVVTFNLKQAELIEQEMEDLAEQDEAFRTAWIEELSRTQNGEDMGFFVKNLENVQGDERDWIIFSTTFSRDHRGIFRRNFGVLGQHGGERRLNVAVTRAREKVLLITSMPVGEVSTWSGQGGRRPPSTPRDFLQGWLAYAERLHAGEFEQSRQLLHAVNGQHASHFPQHQRRAAASRFVEEVGAFIRQLGHEPVPAQGDAFGLDFAITHPTTGQFGLGIECDSHHHPVLASARARELWRPSVLRSSIPHLHRVNSRRWYHDRPSEQQRLRTAIQRALSA